MQAKTGLAAELRWRRRDLWQPLTSLWAAGLSAGLAACSTPRQAEGGGQLPDVELIRRAQILAQQSILGILQGRLTATEATDIKARSQARHRWGVSTLASHPSSISITLFTLVKGDWGSAHTYLEVEAQGWGGGKLGGMYGPLANLPEG